MKYIASLCLIIASIVAGSSPFPLSDDTLSPQCQTPECPAIRIKDGTPIILPYPLDCLQYIICKESGLRIVACSTDLIFNKVKDRADPRDRCRCRGCRWKTRGEGGNEETRQTGKQRAR
ncbi:hypothetical protein EAG_02893 [Camponotus floridanus]|uniref:Chitin-binding type-2 domain-containing protein n=1 Tax=Camponotus floridanus TaxID=104421 RepID=E2AGH3_CAMFO|nr:hypothetical protein EAG_02893 [Camponotus floridanus]